MRINNLNKKADRTRIALEEVGLYSNEFNLILPEALCAVT
jgi:hypothetical protein